MTKNKSNLEDWHNNARKFLELVETHPELLELAAQFPKPSEVVRSPRLNTEIAGIKLDNPLMVGAGWDKTGMVVKGLVELGFAGVEVGSIQNFPQDGNPLPRHFELSEGVTINRYGFNSPGAQVVANNLKSYEKENLVIGINIGKNKEIPDIATMHMIAAVAERLYKYASYIVINVSSPNTPKLRKLLKREPLDEIVKSVQEVIHQHNSKPLFIKISPDQTIKDIDHVIDIVINNKADGIIASNTTSSRNIKSKYGDGWKYEAGGLSGDDDTYRKKVTKHIAHIYKQTQGKITIIGAGGVKDTATALEKIRAGASAVQLVTAIKYEGLDIANKINGGILDWMDENGVEKVTDLIGVDVS